MTPRPGTTDELQPGMYLQDLQGATLRVETRGPSVVVVSTRTGEKAAWKLPTPAKPITILEPTHDEALAVVQRQLGAEVVGDRTKPDTWKIPSLGASLGKWRHHMFLFHGQWANDKGSDLKTCREFHTLDHDDPDHRARGYVDHEH